jgi:MarR family transcriptional regulator, organic hydroperoxide resistance regulator
MDKGDGVSVKAVSKMLHVDPSFVTTQSKMRIVQMSLTDKSYKHIASLASQQEALNEFIFAEFGDRELAEFTGKLASLAKRLERAHLKVAMDL